MADEVEAFEMRDLDTGQQQVIFDLESGEGQNEVFTFSLPGQVPDFYASAGSAPAPPAPASAGTAVVLDGQPLTAVLAGAADVRDPKDTYTVYIILVCRSHHSPEKPAVWTVFRRYRAFKTLAEALKRRNVSVAVPLPSKLWLLGTLDADFLRRRRQGLEAWLSSLLTTTAAATPQLFSFPEVQAFFSEHADDLPKGIDVAAYRAALADLEAEAVAAAEAVPHAPAPAAPAPAPVTYHYTHVSLGGAAAAPAVGAAPGPPPRAEAAARAGGEGPAKHTPVPPPPRSTAPAAPPAAAVPAVAGPATSAPGAGARPLPAATRSSSRPSAAAPRIGLDSFELLKVIGKGSFGKVLLVRKKDGGSLYAMKVLSKQNIVKRKQVEHTITERRVLSYTRHPFIVALHYAFQTRDKLFLVVDLALGGELFFHLGRLGRFAQDMTCFYTAELVLAIGHLHKLGVVYRDLKPENVLLDAEGHVRLADFGLSKEGITASTEGTKSFCGTPEYLAPEILDRLGHGTAVDWWSLGMLCYEMLTGLPPWYTRDRKKLYERLRGAPLVFPDFVEPVARSFLSGLLTRNPAERLGGRGGLKEVQAHPFFASIDFGALLRREIPPPFVPQLRGEVGDVRYFDDQFTSLPPTVLMDDDKEAAGADGKPASGSGGAASPSSGDRAAAAAASGRASFVGRTESVSGGLFHGFTYESPTMMSYLARASNAADLSRGSRAGSLAMLPGFSFAEAAAPPVGSLRRSGSALFSQQQQQHLAASLGAAPPAAERGISGEIAAGMDAAAAARRVLAPPSQSGLAQALAAGRAPPSGLAAALAANGAAPARV